MNHMSNTSRDNKRAFPVSMATTLSSDEELLVVAAACAAIVAHVAPTKKETK